MDRRDIVKGVVAAVCTALAPRGVMALAKEAPALLAPPAIGTSDGMVWFSTRILITFEDGNVTIADTGIASDETIFKVGDHIWRWRRGEVPAKSI